MRFSPFLLLLLAAPASADEPYIPPPVTPPAPVVHGEFGAGVGVTFDHFANVFIGVEGAMKLPELPLWVRGSAGTGSTGDFEGGGNFARGVVGIDARRCGRIACLIGGVEAGLQRQTWESYDWPTEHHRGALYGGRVGFDAGNDSWRFAMMFEKYVYVRKSDVMQLDDKAEGGGGLTLNVLHRL